MAFLAFEQRVAVEMCRVIGETDVWLTIEEVALSDVKQALGELYGALDEMEAEKTPPKPKRRRRAKKKEPETPQSSQSETVV